MHSRTPDDQQQRPVPHELELLTETMEPGAHPTRQPGHRPTCHRLDKPKRTAGEPDGPSRKIEAKRSLKGPIVTVIARGPAGQADCDRD